MAKKVVNQVKLQIPAGKANPAASYWSRPGCCWREHPHVLQGVQRAPQKDAGEGLISPPSSRVRGPDFSFKSSARLLRCAPEEGCTHR